MCEILAPVKSKNNLITAINAGADAVYLGLKDFSARKTADNFDFDELKYGVAYAKCFGVKVYVAVNTLVKENEINDFIETVNKSYSFGVDAFILQDIFLGKYLKEKMPNITLHLSTQAGVSNKYGAILAKKSGFSRVILARETTLDDIKEISSIIETEVFIQGALCTCFSGHCYFSSFIGGNSGNRGYCKQPCRKEYVYENNGKTLKKGYVLSLSDLCVGENVAILKEIGVKSFKIEGRLRSEEYLASAVMFYKELLKGNFNKTLFYYMKIAFNRGDYTKGLAFSQDKNFISSEIQNNKGLFVGKIDKINKDVLTLDRSYSIIEGDSFKIIRNNIEVGSAIALNSNGKLEIKFKGNVKTNDNLHITKKVNLLNLLNLKKAVKEIEVIVNVKVGDKLKLSSCGISVESDNVLEMAKTQPTTKLDVISNINRTDVYPFLPNVKFENFDENAFIQKSVLNTLRSKLYELLFYKKISKKPYNIEKYIDYSICKNEEYNFENAVIVSSLKENFDGFNNVIFAPHDYNNFEFLKLNNVKTWLYVPPFVNGTDIKIIDKIVDKFYGIYSDGTWALEYAKERNLKVFCGVGFNVFNSINVTELQRNDVYAITLSKELSLNEINSFKNKNLYVLSDGNIELMDLIYCPFSKNCKNCEILNEFTLKDAENREFTVKKYKMSTCRFKVYNMAKLKEDRISFNKLIDLSVTLPVVKTTGNFIKGVK